MSEETSIKVEEVVVKDEVKAEAQSITMTPELASFIEKQVNEKTTLLQKENDEKMESFKTQHKQDFIKEQEQIKINKEKEVLINQINSSESLKKKFDDFGIDYNTIDNQNLTNYVKIWGVKKAENTAAPEGKKLNNSQGTVKDAVKGMQEAMAKSFNGGK